MFTGVLKNVLGRSKIAIDKNGRVNFAVLHDFAKNTSKVQFVKEFQYVTLFGAHTTRMRQQSFQQHSALLIFPLVRTRDTVTEEGVFSLGREDVNSMVVRDYSISLRHFDIHVKNDQFYIKDCDSITGTILNGSEVGCHFTPLNEQDKIRAGQFTFELFYPESLYDLLSQPTAVKDDPAEPEYRSEYERQIPESEISAHVVLTEEDTRPPDEASLEPEEPEIECIPDDDAFLHDERQIEKTKAIIRIVSALAFFKTFNSYEREYISLQDAHIRRFGVGEYIVQQDSDDRDLYILLQGEVNIVKEGVDQMLNRLMPGHMFGEISFLTPRKRLTHAIAAEPTMVLAISPSTLPHLSADVREKLKDSILEQLIRRLANQERKLYSSPSLAKLTMTSNLIDGHQPPPEDLILPQSLQSEALYKYVKKIPVFSNLSPYEIYRVARAVPNFRIYEQNEPIIYEGQRGEHVYILLSGAARIVKKDLGHPVGFLSVGTCFGEGALSKEYNIRLAGVEAEYASLVLALDSAIMAYLGVFTREKLKDQLISLMIERLDKNNRILTRVAKKIE
ncbi:cyclic nucleotide-binding domain-containing protein [Magnetococcales bacterium HHB-1]